MQRTEPSVGRTGPKGQISRRLKGVGSAAEDSELEDLALAYGARLPDSVMRPLYLQFSDPARAVMDAPPPISSV